MDIKLLWRRELHQRAASRAVLTRGLILSPERRTKLVRCSPETGDMLWEAPVRNTYGWPSMDKDRCYWLDQHSKITAFDLDTGAPRWTTSLDGIFGLVTVSGPTVMVGGWRGYTRPTGLAAASGASVWRLPKSDPVGKPLAVPQGFLVPLPREAILVDHSGHVVQRLPMPPGYRPSDGAPDIIAIDETLWSATRDGHLWHFESGGATWTSAYRHPEGIHPWSIHFAAPHISFRDRAGGFWTFDLRTREPRGRHELAPQRGVASILQLHEGLALATHPNSGVQLVDKEGTTVAALRLDKMLVTPLARAGTNRFLVGTSSAIVAVTVSHE